MIRWLLWGLRCRLLHRAAAYEVGRLYALGICQRCGLLLALRWQTHDEQESQRGRSL